MENGAAAGRWKHRKSKAHRRVGWLINRDILFHIDCMHLDETDTESKMAEWLLVAGYKALFGFDIESGDDLNHLSADELLAEIRKVLEDDAP